LKGKWEDKRSTFTFGVTGGKRAAPVRAGDPNLCGQTTNRSAEESMEMEKENFGKENFPRLNPAVFEGKRRGKKFCVTPP